MNDQLVRIALTILLVYWTYQLIHPLLGVIVWAFILAIALYPFYEWVNKRIGKHPAIAASIVTLLSLALVVGSLLLLSSNMYGSAAELTTKIRYSGYEMPQLPDYIKNWPIVGEEIHDTWSSISDNLSSTLKQYSDYLLKAGKYLLSKTAGISFDIILFIASVLLSGYLLSKSKELNKMVNAFAKRISPRHGSVFINIMKDTIQNVSRGVVGLSLLQTLLFGILLVLAGVPGASLISFVALITGIAQIGLSIIALPVIIWLFFTKAALTAVLWSVPLVIVSIMDNFLKPFVFARGLQTPMVVIFAGVIGGLITQGVLGVFIGPVVFAIAYDLLTQWASGEQANS